MKIKDWVQKIFLTVYVEVKLLTESERYFDNRAYCLFRPLLVSWYAWLAKVDREEAESTVRDYAASPLATEDALPCRIVENFIAALIRNIFHVW